MTPDALEDLLPPKCDLQTVKVVVDSGDTVTVFFIAQQPLLFEQDDIIYPSGT